MRKGRRMGCIHLCLRMRLETDVHAARAKFSSVNQKARDFALSKASASSLAVEEEFLHAQGLKRRRIEPPARRNVTNRKLDVIEHGTSLSQPDEVLQTQKADLGLPSRLACRRVQVAYRA